ncbi:MAG: Cell division protein FtsI [Oscillospiraceae bacterium]|nr:Cell division protein FtsI [Oscillospiraceae bacterium]
MVFLPRERRMRLRKTIKPTDRGAERQRANSSMFCRIIILMIVFGAVIFMGLLVRLFYLQVIQHDFYEEKAVSQQTRSTTVTADRGTIYDAKGNILAISATVQTLILSPLDVQEDNMDQDAIVNGLVEILGLDADKLRERLQKTNSAYEILRKNIEEDQADELREFIAKYHLSAGLYLVPDSKRYYPYSTMASQVIGFINADKAGAYGIEAKYEDELSGESGRVVIAKNAAGTEMLSRYANYVDAVDGDNLTLTIDATIQSYAEKILAEGIETYDIQNGGFCIVMNPNTGAVLAMASSPNYDLNDYSTLTDTELYTSLKSQLDSGTITEDEYWAQISSAQLEQWRDKNLGDTYEPGSTFKALVLAAALEEGVVDDNTMFYCPGYAVVAGTRINCSKHSGHGSQNLAQAVQNSCNPAFIAIGQKLGAEKFYDYMEKYGLMEKTGIDLPSETVGQLWSREDFTGDYGITSLATASFGQRLTVTPIRLITSIASVINGGYLLTPYVVQSVTDSDGNTVYNAEKQVVRQTVSSEVSSKVREILESVVSEGTGKNAYQAGYRIGGKTGTSETLVEGRYIVSFMGFAPADDPQVIVLLAYDNPKEVGSTNLTAGGYYISGGNMAAPMAGQLIAEILDYMGVEKEYTEDELASADVTVPNVVGCTEEAAAESLQSNGLSYRTVGSGATVTAQIPAKGATIPGNSEVILYMGEQAPTDEVEVPDLSGMTVNEVKEAFSSLGLYLRSTGTTDSPDVDIANNQDINAGSMVDRGTVIEVRFTNQVTDWDPG